MNIDLSYLSNGKRVDFQVEAAPDGRPAVTPRWDELPEIKDMVVSDQVTTTYGQALTLGVQEGFEEIPLLGGSIYDSKTNANYPKLIPGDEFVNGVCAFAEVKEGEEIPFGTVEKKVMDALAIKGYAVGFQFTKEARMFGNTGELSQKWSRALGKAHNALRNHLRFYPIISETYNGDNATSVSYMKADGTAGDSSAYALEQTVYATLLKGIKKCKAMKRPASVIVCAAADEDVIRECVERGTMYGTKSKGPLSAAGIKKIEVYDGAALVVGGETTTYTGVTAGAVYLVRPLLGFFERVKQDLLIDVGDADKSRLVENEVIADAWLGVYAKPLLNVQKLAIPTE